MLLNRLRMRGRLAVLVGIPLVAVMALSVVMAVGQVRRANAASATARSVNVASHVGAVIAELAQERLVSIGFLRGVSSATTVTLQRSATDDSVANLQESLGGEMSPDLRAALQSVSSLNPLRTLVDDNQALSADVIAQFGARIAAILDSLRLIDGVDVGTADGRAVVALDALIRLDELRNEGAAMLVATAGIRDDSAIVGYAGVEAAIPQLQSQFTSYATSAQASLYTVVVNAYTARTGAGFASDFAADPVNAVVGVSAAELFPQLTSFVQLGQSAETKIATDVTTAVGKQRSRALLAAYLYGAFALLVVLLVAALSIVVARSMVRSLRDLTDLADRVGGLTEAELARVADDDTEMVESIRFDPLNIGARDEFSDLAGAFTRVQLTAAALVERQAQGRRNVAQMYGHIGRRTQNLVSRQLAIIDGLSLDEPDADRLRELYRLDHVTSRLRRNASSLVVLSGASDEGAFFTTLSLGDVIRRALGEIEDDRRVDIDVPVNTSVQPAIINDLVLMLAELIENAITFSPPHTRVLVTSEPGAHTVQVIDEGIGMSPRQLAEENQRLAERERLDLAPTEVLGLFVVGRLARRHGIAVTLEETDGETEAERGGVTVIVDLGSYAVHTQRTESPLYAGRALGRAMVPAGGPSRPPLLWPEPIALAAVPFDIAKLEHATKVLEEGSAWNAFEVEVQPALGAQPHPARGIVIAEYTYPEHQTYRERQPEPTREPGYEPRPDAFREPSREPSREPNPETVREPSRETRPEPSDRPIADGATTISLARRVPGATTVHEQSFLSGAPATRPLDPSEARDLVEQFEFGVAQALREVRSHGERFNGFATGERQGFNGFATVERSSEEPAYQRDDEDTS